MALNSLLVLMCRKKLHTHSLTHCHHSHDYRGCGDGRD